MLLLITTCMTVIIIVGPFLRAVEDRDYYEIAIDVILISFFWGIFLLISHSSGDLIELINRALD